MLKFFSMSAAAIVIAVAAGVATAAPEQQSAVTTTVTVATDGDVIYKVAGPLDAGKYWLGIECLPVPPPVRAQLSLPENQGLLVIVVMPESPAAKAGVKQHDVLVRVGDKPLTDLRDLVEAVDAAKSAKLKIELIRGGKPQSVEATPTKRPETFAKTLPPPEAGDWNTIQKWMEGVWARGEGREGRPMQFFFARPGAIVPKDVLVPRPLPPDMSVVISRQGDKPADITVKRGDKKWEVTEKQLDKLPADVRPFVEQMLGRVSVGVFGGMKATMPGAMLPESERGKMIMGMVQPGMGMMAGPGMARLEKRLDAMEGRIDRLLQAVEDLRDNRGQQPAPKPHQEQ